MAYHTERTIIGGIIDIGESIIGSIIESIIESIIASFFENAVGWFLKKRKARYAIASKNLILKRNIIFIYQNIEIILHQSQNI